MMPNLEEIYDRSFFEEWGPAHEKYVRTARVITEKIIDEHSPKTVSDVGCGCAVYSDWFRKKGVKTFAYDGVIPDENLRFVDDVIQVDLTDPSMPAPTRTDLAICLEVAEHIPEEFSDVFLKNLGQFSDQILLSAAPVGQGGHHHVNERPKRYWVGKMAQAGYAYNRKKTGVLVERLKHLEGTYKWMGEHISFYERITGQTPKGADLPFAVRL